jgi:hypothetical protein
VCVCTDCGGESFYEAGSKRALLLANRLVMKRHENLECPACGSTNTLRLEPEIYGEGRFAVIVTPLVPAPAAQRAQTLGFVTLHQTISLRAKKLAGFFVDFQSALWKLPNQ